MLFNLIIFFALGVTALAVFYLIIRIKDISASLAHIGERLPLSDEMRRQASQTIESLNERIGSLNQKAQVMKDVMNEVTSLRNLFTMPKAAGSAGERLLEKALDDILQSGMYETQYRLSSGTVDFVIKFKDCMVPVDSKLSLEDFNRMLGASDPAQKRAHWKNFTMAAKKRIDETVYYEAFVKSEQFGEPNGLMDYAMKKKVYPASPQTIYPYLITILQGMKALRIEENARDILGKVNGLRNDFERFKSIYGTIIGHIEDAHKKHSNEAHTAITRLEQHISSLEHKSK
jgi:DNA recombination protein RmuC